MNHFLRFKEWIIGGGFHINSLKVIQEKCSQIWEYPISERDDLNLIPEKCSQIWEYPISETMKLGKLI